MPFTEKLKRNSQEEILMQRCDYTTGAVRRQFSGRLWPTLTGPIERIRNAAGICGLALTLAALAPVRAQDIRIVHFSGVIRDYTPASISGGPWELGGQWTLDVQRTTGTADFTADLTMETSDYGITGATQVDPNNPTTRSPHTHHISVTNATVSYDTSVCPANSPATTGTSGVVVTSPATTAANGSPAPFEAKGSSSLQICIMGGSEVDFSNVTLVYTGAATTHFGTQPIHGVVSKVSTQ